MQSTERLQSAKDIERTPCACSTGPFLLVSEAATVLKVSKSYLYGGLREGRFPGVQFGDSYRMRSDFVFGFICAPSGTRFEDYATNWITQAQEGVAQATEAAA